ncbi:hypothetical protein EVAR_76914_1 [Eumeta japonica]|uniref:Uncharacterized protein n=1 Tax=Eumeta variegata TaxID=151549 RepID=A0A4C1SEY4_EUMVA|nr:hypothetical protein EVAR_76914_1 [Eumeta japonica]
MFQIQGVFEQSLRGGDDGASSGVKTLATLAKIHKHCTGKAHANGCADHSSKNALSKSDSSASLQSRRSFKTECIIEIKDSDKNHINSPQGHNDIAFTKSFSNSTSSYEGHSDTDSETTSKIRQDIKIMDPCERLFSQNTKASLAKTAKMRYSDNASLEEMEVDNKQAFSRNSSRTSFRERKSAVVTIDEVKSDCSANDEDLANAVLFNEKKNTPTNGKIILTRRNSSGSTGKNSVNGTKPPWRGASKTGVSPETFVRSPSLRGSVRKKTNRTDGVPWKKLYELSLWRKCGVSFASVEADTDRALLRPWREFSALPEPLPDLVSHPRHLLRSETTSDL